MKTITKLRQNLIVLAINRSLMHTQLDIVRKNLTHMSEKGINMKQLREARRAADHMRFQCIVCTESNQNYQHFMASDELWEEYVGRENVCLCLPCFEQVLGREIEEEDLKKDKRGAHLVINYPLLEEPEPETLLVDDEADRAKQVASNEAHYASILDRLLTPEQRESLEDTNENGNGKPYGLTADPIEGVKKRAVQKHKRRGRHNGPRKKK